MKRQRLSITRRCAFVSGVFMFIAILISITAWRTLHPNENTIVYLSDAADIANPERGFYVVAEGAPGELSAQKLEKLRTEYSIKTPSANYALNVTLLYRGYLLSDFLDKDISASYLNQLRDDFSAIREAGLKVILRFAYTNTSKKGDCPDGAICPPYGDAPKERVLRHIEQLKPLLIENADIIAVLQQGFIGIWGENYYTDYFGDASSNGDGFVSDKGWNDRNEVLKSLLDALPKDRMVQVRTPQMKQRFLYGPDAPVTSPAMTLEEAFDGTDRSRIGMHNDCFLASVDDYGTFYDNGNSSSGKKPANKVLRKYFEADSRYTAIGGETCDDTFSPQNDCAPFGHAEQEMASMHYSYLNANYNNLVNNDWEEQGCMINIKRKLGYRLEILKATIPLHAKIATPLSIRLELENVGFASPFNPRQMELILRNKADGSVTALTVVDNIQKIFTGKFEVNKAIQLPQGLKAGDYEVLLNLPDKYPSIKNRPEYSIRLANRDIWEDKTGYNRLNHILKLHQ